MSHVVAARGRQGRVSSRVLIGASMGVIGLWLAACSTAAPPAPTRPAYPAPTTPTPPLPVSPQPGPGVSPAALPGWAEEDHLGAFNAYLRGCGVLREPAARRLCEHAKGLAAGRVTPSDARVFLEASFTAIEADPSPDRPSLLTAYFAPEYPARRRPDPEFSAPVLPAPASPKSAGDRAAIEGGARADRALAWMRAEDLFFMQIQGSGYLTFEDGGRMRAAYAADNGKPFVGIARPMAQQGLLPANGTSGEAISRWLADHRGTEAQRVMALNPRYIFFRTDPDDGGDPAGAAGVPLPARRAIAIDPASWRYGDLAWVEADGGNLRGARSSYRGLVMALDTGSAIRGPVRADLYMGRGQAAGAEAGSVRHPLRIWRLVPRLTP